MNSKERFIAIDDEVDEIVEDLQDVYDVSYVEDEGPYQSIMVRADSEEEAIEKFKKQHKNAEVIGAALQHDVEEMKRRGKPILEEITDDQSVREWYIATYPNDKLGYEINDWATFNGVNGDIEAGEDIYATIGVSDSIVRERIFQKIADLTGVSYYDIYEKWINNDNRDPHNA